jgi:hypothetical protein
MVDFGAVKCILGINVVRNEKRKSISLSQADYIEDILWKFRQNSSRTKVAPLDVRMKYTKEMAPQTEEERRYMAKVPFRKALGCLNYLVQCTRPDIASAVHTLAKFAEDPGVEHWNAIQHILQYLRRTKHFGLVYEQRQGSPLHAFADANFAELDTRRSTSGFVFLLSGAAISWLSKLQTGTAQSTMEAEIVAIGMAAMEVQWYHEVMKELTLPLSSPVTVWSDSQGAVARILNPVFHESTKHIDVKWNLTKEKIQAGLMELKFVSGAENVADILTKALDGSKTEFCRNGMGVRDVRPFAVKERDKT